MNITLNLLFLLFVILIIFFSLFLNNDNIFYNYSINNIDNVTLKNMFIFFNDNTSVNFYWLDNLFNIVFLPELLLFIWSLFSIIFYINYKILNKNITSNVISFFAKITINFYIFIFFYIIFFLFFVLKNNCYFYKSFLIFNYYTFIIKLILLFLMIIIVYFLKLWIIKNKKNILEFFFLLHGCLLFSFLIISSINLFGVYISLEGISLQVYALAALNFTEISIEIALKYFLLGSVISGILLYGITLLYSNIFSINFFVLKNYFLNIMLLNDYNLNNLSFSLKLSIFFLLFSLFFKLGVFPLHNWVIGVYNNSPNPILAFFAIMIKFIFFFIFLNIFYFIFFDISKLFQPIIILGSISSLLFGAIGAFKENRIKTFIGYTAINQIGFLLLGFSCNTSLGVKNSIFYLLIYIFLLCGFFNFFLNTYQIYTNKPLLFFSDIKYFNKKNPLLSFLIAFFLFSFAGLPPFAGFFGKYFLFVSLINSNMYFLLIISLFSSLISLYYYIKIIKNIWFENLINFKINILFFKLNNNIIVILLIFILSFFNFFFLIIINQFDYFVIHFFFSILNI